MRRFSLRHFLTLIILAIGTGAFVQAGNVPDGVLEIQDYHQNFTSNPVSSSKFNPPLGWSNYTDGTSVSYSSASFNGGYGIGATTDQTSQGRYNMIVTPQIKGTMTFKVRRYAYSDYYKFNIEFFRLTKGADGTFTFNKDTDRIAWTSPFADDATGTDWLQETQSLAIGADYTYVGIRMTYAYIGDITATSALIPELKDFEISSISMLDGFTEKVKSDEDGNINIGLKVMLKNTGNTPLGKSTEGDRWNYTIANYTSSYGNPYTFEPLYQGDLPDLPVGSDPVEFKVIAKIPAPTSGELQNDGSIRTRLDFIENFSDKDIDKRYKAAGWYYIMSNKGVMELRYDKKTSATQSTTTTVDATKPIYIGAFVGSRTFTFKMRNRGVGDIVIDAIEKPDWITLEDMAVGTTLTSDEEKEFKVTISGTPGHKEGSVKFQFDGISISDEISLIADVAGEGGFLAGFEGTDALDGWYQPSTEKQWTVEEYTSNDRSAKNSLAEYGYNDKKLTNGRQATPGFEIYSPMLSFSEGELLSFWAAKKANSGSDVYLEVKYSTDRANWTSLGKITPTNEDQNLRFYCSDPAKPTSDGKDIMKHFQLAMPAGNYYISLTAGYVSVDNLFGGKKVDVPYDIVPESAQAGKTRIVNNPLEFTAGFRNINANDVEAEGMTVALYANGVKVAETEGQTIKASEAVDFTMSYIPHNPGNTELYAILAIGDYTVSSPILKVDVDEESASVMNQIGQLKDKDSNLPLSLNYNNSKSEFVYTAEMLKEMKGSKILKVSYPYFKTSDSNVAETVTIWMENTDETTVGDNFAATDNLVKVAEISDYTFQKQGASLDDLAEMTFKLDTPFEYDGRNLRVVIEKLGTDYKTCSFVIDNTVTCTARHYELDNRDSYLKNRDGAGSTVKNKMPVINLYTELSVAEATGTVKDDAGQPISNAVVTAKAKDTEVYYEAVTDETGSWTITIYQDSYDYTVTAVADGYFESDPADLDFTASNDIVLTKKGLPSTLTVEVTAETETSTEGLLVTLTGKENGYIFDPAKVKADGTVKFTSVPAGVYVLTVDGSPMGLEKYVDNNLLHERAQTVTVTLREAVRTPYALNTTLNHDEFTGSNSVLMSWNRETDYFFDDFESYEPFAIEFEPWTGYDVDKEPAVEIQGLYPNRGIQQYATIFNPLTIDPPVYYEYEVLRPFSGKQCVGFVRTRSGNANNDWLISPKVKVGVNNVVSFLAKASEQVPDRFAVCVSRTGTDLADFVQLTPGNYQTVDYKGWKEITYSLAEYEGEEVYVAIHCMSQNSFMFMVDDFYVGPANIPMKARRVSRRSAENPNEVFIVTLDGEEVARTEDYTYLFNDIAAGPHTLGVSAKYINAQTEESVITVDVPGAEAYASLTVKLTPDVDDVTLKGQKISLMNKESGRLTVIEANDNNEATVGFLPKGTYLINLESEIFDDYTGELDLDSDKTLDISLKEAIIAPYNLIYQINPSDDGLSDVELWWNRDAGYRDGFEGYEDFTQEIGDWTVLDLDKMPTYAFQIGDALIVYPETRGEVGAMVFNPYATLPVPASDDGLFLTPDGIKYVMFNSAEMAQSNDWLISPTVKIGPDYVLRFTAKSYQDFYAGSFEFCALSGKDIASATVLDAFYLTDEWTRYEISLADFEGQSIEIGFHHTTYDGWLSFIDDVYVGPSEESAGESPATARCTFDIFLDNALVDNVKDTYFKFAALSEGTHKAGVQALYPSGKKSDIAEIQFTVDKDGVITILPDDNKGSWQWYDLNGLKVDAERLQPGIYIRTNGTKVEKVIIR